MENDPTALGLQGLKAPALPLVRIVQLLYITGPFTTVAEVVDELNEPIETNAATYDDPKAALTPYLDLLAEFERLKNPTPASYAIQDTEGNELDPMEAMEAFVSHGIMTRELEGINSLLCGPRGCTLCCVGPEADQEMAFFEIPLQEPETAFFPLNRLDTRESRQLSAQHGPELMVEGHPFYDAPPSLVHWRQGWSLILPKGHSCPNLEPAKKICLIYPDRPQVCRRPQIFSYVLEESADQPGDLPTYICHRKILAIWDCPYVKEFKQEIGAYAEMCELEPVFKENKR